MTAAQLTLDLGHRPAQGADDFLVADCNREAISWLDLWPDWPGPALVVYGPAGCGKTHLAQVWRARSRAGLITGAALAGGDPPALLGQGAGLVIDSAEEAAALAAEAALLHLYNLAAESGRHLLLMAASAPSRWPLRLADLASRLRAAPAVAIREPDDALLAAVLVKLFADRQVRVKEPVIRLLLSRMERSFAAARQLVARLDHASLAAGRPITPRLAAAVMAEPAAGDL